MWYLIAFNMTLIFSEAILVMDLPTHVFSLDIKHCDLFLTSWELWWLQTDKSATYFIRQLRWFLFLLSCNWDFKTFWGIIIRCNIPGTQGNMLLHVISLVVWYISLHFGYIFFSSFYSWSCLKTYLTKLTLSFIIA